VIGTEGTAIDVNKVSDDEANFEIHLDETGWLV
jgi:hypothetical protein